MRAWSAGVAITTCTLVRARTREDASGLLPAPTRIATNTSLSSKVGKLAQGFEQNNGRSNFPFSPSPNNVVFDIRRRVRRPLRTPAAARRQPISISVFVHDHLVHNKLPADPWQQQFESRSRVAFPPWPHESGGIIKGWALV